MFLFFGEVCFYLNFLGAKVQHFLKLTNFLSIFFSCFLKIFFKSLIYSYLFLKNNLGNKVSGSFFEKNNRNVAPKKPVP